MEVAMCKHDCHSCRVHAPPTHLGIALCWLCYMVLHAPPTQLALRAQQTCKSSDRLMYSSWLIQYICFVGWPSLYCSMEVGQTSESRIGRSNGGNIHCQRLVLNLVISAPETLCEFLESGRNDFLRADQIWLLWIILTISDNLLIVLQVWSLISAHLCLVKRPNNS